MDIFFKFRISKGAPENGDIPFTSIMEICTYILAREGTRIENSIVVT